MIHDPAQHPKPQPDPSKYSSNEAKEGRLYWLDSKKNVDKVFYGLCVLCALSAATDMLIHRHVIFEIETVFAFYGVYGFVACVGLVVAAKELRKLLKREEDYYDDDS